MNLLPVLTWSVWFSPLLDDYRTFKGESKLPVYECDKVKVQTKHGHVRPLGRANREISFSAWQMAHAVVKADCAREQNPRRLAVAAIGFLLEHVHLFDWRYENELRLSAGMSDYYADFTNTSLAGRVAQGMALLFLEEQGYAYVGRFSEVKAKLKKTGTTPAREPDFIVENGKGKRALAEAKGAFLKPNATCNIKGTLGDALEQLDGWDRYITPQPIKNFAIGTFLREVKDPFGEPSLLAFVDPEPGEPERRIEIPSDAVRRANYASWLALMGFDDVAQRLRTGDGSPRRRTVQLIKLHGRSYVVAIAWIQPWVSRQSLDAEFWRFIGDWPHPFWPPSRNGVWVQLFGLDLEVVRALEPADSGLMSLNPYERREIFSEVDGGIFYGSVFSDGSLLGELRITRFDGPIIPRFGHPIVESIEVYL